MKRMKKYVSLLLTVLMVLALGMTAFAANTTGSITIRDALKGETYSAYRIFDLESYDKDKELYSYVLSEKWSGFENEEGIAHYFTIDADGYIVWNAATENDAQDVKAFAGIAMSYAKANNIDADRTAEADESWFNGTEVVKAAFENLPLGYYLLDSSLGTLCSLDTMNPTATIREKNVVPTIAKEVEEDSTGTFGESNDADITQTVNYKSTITVQAGTENYVLHDKMDAGLTFAGTVKVSYDGEEIANPEGKYELVVGPTDGDTFDIVFEDDYIQTLVAGKNIVVEYSATLNAKAAVGKAAGNKNSTQITYGNASESTWDETTTYTWKFDVFKYTLGDNNAQVPLEGAQFVLYKTEGTATKYATLENDIITGWVDTEEAATKLTSKEDGKIAIIGLDTDTYYLKETVAPEGYNLLKTPITVVIGAEGALTQNGDPVDQIEVLNKAGFLLPSTGGVGTTMFYVAGVVLMLGAAVLLVFKKRVSK